jgi:hypothetical protein
MIEMLRGRILCIPGWLLASLDDSCGACGRDVDVTGT